MGAASGRVMSWGAAQSVAPLALFLALAVAGEAAAGVAGSKHDFTGLSGLDKGSACSPCHIPHHAADLFLIWPRSLDVDERSYYNINQGSSNNYIPGGTLLCYDCHDTGTTSNADDDPASSLSIPWQKSTEPFHFPQDIAIDGSSVGYYELIDGTKPTTGNLPTAGSPTGGHYWKSEPNDAQKKGDKIACSLCHDPHDVMTGGALTKNDVFFRTTTWDGGEWERIDQYGENLRKSKNARKPDGNDDRGNGRKMCANCHGYSDSGNNQESFFNVTAPKPPASVSVHALNDEASAVACTSCHKHNKIVANCSDCHGFPPTSGAHLRHKDALGASFDCAACHGPDPGSATWHNQNNGTVLQANIDIMGQSSWWDADNTRGAGATGYVGTASSETLPSGYEFVAKGGDNQRCFGLACHGNPPNTADALNWTDNMLDDGGESGPFEIAVCTWCHDASPAALDKDGGGATYDLVKAPNIMGSGTSWGAEVNGHGKTSGNYEGDAVGEGSPSGRPAANKNCAKCHDATYTAGVGPDKAHFDGSYSSAGKRLNDSINGETLSGLISGNMTASDAACIACHQRTTGSDDGLQVSSHGNTSNNYTRLEAEFQALCRSCHEPHGRNWNGTSRNLHMIGKWIDSTSSGTWGATDAGEEARVDSNMATQATAPAVSITTGDNAVVFTSRTGADSFDENDGAYNPANDTDDVCATCHEAATGGGDGTGGGSHYGSSVYTEDQRGNNCTLCHSHDSDVTYAYDAFLGVGGGDIEQFFDTASSATNYDAVSGHPLDLSATKTYADPPDCIGCHQTSGGTGTSNECLKCHYEGWLNGSTWTWSGHMNGSLELRASGSSAPPYSAACNPGTNCLRIPKRSTNVDVDGTADVYTHCLVCHDGDQTTAPYQLGNPAQDPPDIVPSGQTWTGGIGHGSSAQLGTFGAGPPDYDCGACHASTQPVATGKSWPTYHASVNEKLVANTTSYSTPEYDTTVEKNSWCATRCHGVNGANRTDKVVDHTWAPDSSESADQTDCASFTDPASQSCETHPSYDTIVEGALFQLPAGLPYDQATDQFICGTCHEPHGNGVHGNASVQMIRLNYSDGTLCGQCHK